MGQNLIIDYSPGAKNVDQNRDERNVKVLNAGRDEALKGSQQR